MPNGLGSGLARAALLAGLLSGAEVSAAQGPQLAGDTRAAETRAAQQAVERSDTAVQGLEHSAAPRPETLSEARAERSELVLAWRRQADAWAAADPGNAEAKAAVAQSIKAMEAFYVPGGGLAPDVPGHGNEP